MISNLNLLQIVTRFEFITFLVHGTNFKDFILGLFVFAAIFSPLGFSIITCLNRKISFSRRVYLSPTLGSSLSIALWSLMVTVTQRVNFYLLISVVVLLTIVLLYVIYVRDKSIIQKKEIKTFFSISSIIPLAIFLFFLYFLLLVSVNRVAPCDVDSQANGYFALFSKYGNSYPYVYPFLNDTKLAIVYPPGANLLIAFLSIFSHIPIQTSLLLVQVITLSFSGLALYCVLDVVTSDFKNKTYFLIVATIFFYNGYLWGHLLNGGQVTESVAVMVNIGLLFLFVAALKQKRLAWYVLAGILLGTLMLAHPRFFKWMAMAILFFSIFQLAAKEKKDWKSFLAPFIVLFVGLLWILPWFRLGTRVSLVYEHLWTFNWQFLDYRYGNILPIFFAVGIVAILSRRNNLAILLLVWIVSTLLLGGYMSNAYGSSIVVPIISAYGFLLIINLVHLLSRKIQTRRRKNRYLKILAVFLFCLFFLAATILDPRSYFSNGPIISDADVSALTWLKKNTTYENTLTLNQVDPHYQGHWVPVVSERRSIFSRGFTGIRGHLMFSDKEFEKAYASAKWAFYNITDPKSYQILKKLGITHIYLSAGIPFRNYHTPKEVYEAYEKSPFVRLVYSNNDPSKLHPSWNAPAKVYEVVYQESQNQG